MLDIHLIGHDGHMICLIKEVRAITGLGLKESKDLVVSIPQPVKLGMSEEDANKIKNQLEYAGGVVEIRRSTE